jgi:hypothetical protein
VAGVDAAFMEQVVDIPKRGREPDVQHHRQADDLGGGLEVPEGAGFGGSNNKTCLIPNDGWALLAEQASRVARDRLKLKTNQTGRIPDLGPRGCDPRLATRLLEWWTLPGFAVFRAEVKTGSRPMFPWLRARPRQGGVPTSVFW